MSEIHFVASKFEFLCHLTYKMYLQIVGNTYKVLQINLIGRYFSLVISEISMTNMSVFVARRQEKLLLYSLRSKRFRWAFCTKEIFFLHFFVCSRSGFRTQNATETQSPAQTYFRFVSLSWRRNTWQAQRTSAHEANGNATCHRLVIVRVFI